MTLEVAPATTASGVVVSVSLPATHLCPFRDEVDEGTATVQWRVTAGKTLELHSLRDHLDSLDEWVTSHEEYTAHLRGEVAGAGMRGAAVTTEWSTAGGTVTVRA